MKGSKRNQFKQVYVMYNNKIVKMKLVFKCMDFCSVFYSYKFKQIFTGKWSDKVMLSSKHWKYLCKIPNMW